jgi:hypothetical protein
MLVVNLEALIQESTVPLATSFMPTLSIALSRARPIRNSRERSSDCQQWSTLSLSEHAYSKHAFGQQRSASAESCSTR